MATLTRYTAKFYKDSSKIFYAVFISAGENPISSVEETSKAYSYSVESELLSDGSYKHVLSFAKTTTGSGTVFFSITFDDGTVITASGQIPTDKQILVSPHDSLSFATTFADFNSESETYSIADSVYYSKSPYKTLYIFPSSRTDYLDTSSTEDFYYTTAGSAAYIGSNDLQNSFLNSSDYSVSGVSSNQLGRFIAGNGVQILNFSQYTDASKTGPVVYGYVYVNTTHVPKGGTTFSVSKNRASSNYYLKGCRDFEVPCTADGSAFSNDCVTDTTLTAAIINDSDNIFQDGGCAASCEGFSLKIINTRNAKTSISADGVISAEVLGGKANYTFVLTAVEIGPGLSYGPTTVSGVTTDTREFTDLYAGKYTLKVTDASTSACILTENFIVNSDSAAGTQKGCRQSAAVNYDSGIAAANGFDQLCVYCNSVSGLLIQGVDENNAAKSLGPFAKVSVQSVDNATSLTTTGASNNDGRVILNSLGLSSFNLGFKDSLKGQEFNSGDYFSGGTDFEYKLYSLSRPAADTEITSTYLELNGSVVATQSNVNGAAMAFSSLAPSHYAVKISYTNDGANKEYEDCYIVQQFAVYQEGCTNPNASNYNRLADVDDGSCFFDVKDNCSLGTDLANIDVTCVPDAASRSEYGDLSLKISMPGFDGNGDDLAEFCAMTNPGSLPPGLPALGSQCHFGILFTLNVGITIEAALPDMTFDALCSPGGYEYINIDCNFNNVVAIQLLFKYGGNAPGASSGPFSESYYLEQGDCEYQQLQFISPTGGNSPWEACGCNEEDDGGDDQVVYGCSDPAACNYIVPVGYEWTDDGSCEYTSCVTFGCTDINASNYNPDATAEDGSCTYPIPGCTDSTANNYNPNATEDNGSCDYDLTPCDELQGVLGLNTNESPAQFPENFYATTTPALYGINLATQQCVQIDGGRIVVTIPNTQISALTSIPADSLYWTVGIYNFANGGMSFNFFPNFTVYQYDPEVGGSPEIGYFFQKYVSYLAGASPGSGQTPFSNVIADGDVLGLTDSYVFDQDEIIPGVYLISIYFFTELNPDGTALSTQGDDFEELTTPPNTCMVYNFNVQVNTDSDACVEVLGCTDMAAENYNSLATDDDGTCEYLSGCTDIYAENYNPNTFIDDGSCNYSLPACSPPVPQSCSPNIYISPAIESSDVVTSCCIPKDINTRLKAIEDCLAASGSRFYNKMLTGLSDTCSTMDAWKMVIILEILRKKGLPCVYNCSDQNTPDLQNATCEGVWKNQGSNIWYSTNTYQVGHVVKSPVNNQYYVAVNGINLDLAPNTTVSNTDNPISGWTRCCDESTYSSNINYLTKFLSFVEKYCKDCEIPPYTQDTSIIPTEVESEFTIGGISIENNGSTFGDS